MGTGRARKTVGQSYGQRLGHVGLGSGPGPVPTGAPAWEEVPLRAVLEED